VKTKKEKVTKGAASVERYMVPVVRSTFKILAELSNAGSLGLNEVTQRTKVSKSTVFRVLTTLTQLGYVVRDSDRNYYVSHALASLSSDVAGVELLRAMAVPHMLRLRDEFGETVNLGQLQFDKVTYLEVVPSEYALRLHERAGATVAAHASALGKAILAFSPPEMVEGLVHGRDLPMYTRNTVTDPEELMQEVRRVKERGYALDRGVTSAMATCIGAPILDAHGMALAAISISGPSSRFNPRKDSPVIERLLVVASEIGKQLRNGTPDETRRRSSAEVQDSVSVIK
jgi:IclR family acetate operon transcriptional repressor